MEIHTKGIDYGMGMSNRDASGIRFGVIPQNSGVLQAWADTAEPVYGEAQCHVCGALINLDSWEDDCAGCGMALESMFDCAEPCAWVVEEFGEDGERTLFAHCGEDGDIFVEKSPYFTYAQLCSPCAPGACYLLNPCEPSANNRAYCFDESWFEGEAPYPVYSVATGKLVSADMDSGHALTDLSPAVVGEHMKVLTAQDIMEFYTYLEACTDVQVIGVLNKEVRAGRKLYAQLAHAEMHRRGLEWNPGPTEKI